MIGGLKIIFNAIHFNKLLLLQNIYLIVFNHKLLKKMFLQYSVLNVLTFLKV